MRHLVDKSTLCFLLVNLLPIFTCVSIQNYYPKNPPNQNRPSNSNNQNHNYNYNNNFNNNQNGLRERIVETRCTYIMAATNKVYENQVSQDKPLSYVFFVERKYLQSSHVSGSRANLQQTTNIRIEVGAHPECTVDQPVMFAVRQQKMISTLEVPSESIGSAHSGFKRSSGRPQNTKTEKYYYASRTLCLDSSRDVGFGSGFWQGGSQYLQPQGRNVTVRVSTFSQKPVRFHISLRLTEDFQIPIGKEMEFEITPTAPRYYGFAFSRPDIEQIKIRATSQTSECMTISVQPAQCPVYDLEHNVRYEGLWQTMTTNAAMTVQKRGWFNEGFVLVFVAHSDKEACKTKKNSIYIPSKTNTTRYIPTWSYAHSNQLSTSNPAGKMVKLIVTNESKIATWIIFLCLAIPLIATLLTALVVLCLFRNRHEWMVEIIRDKFPTMQDSQSLLSLPDRDRSVDRSSVATTTDQTMVAEMLLNEIMNDTSSSINSIRRGRRDRNPPTSPARSLKATKSTGDSSGDGGGGGCCHWKADLYIADFNCKEYTEVQKFSKRYYWTIAIVAIFYSIPVYQLVLHYLRVLYRTGEYDICYYNYLCAHRLGLLIDFNHFWSNASYVIFGILFILMVRRRSRNLCVPSQHKQGKGERESRTPSRCQQMHEEVGGGDQQTTGLCCGGGGGSRGEKSPGKMTRICCCTFSRICFRWDHGVPAHFGVFYSLGVALAMEGFLSAAYHLCPNQSTFQFDTCFMYVIAVLLLLKIYQFRHPVHFGANHTFAILAAFVVISVLGLLFEQGTDLAILIFKCIFLPIQYIIMIVIFIHYYAVGYVRDETGRIITDWSIFRNLGQLTSQRLNGDRLILPIISTSICVAVLIYSELGKIGFASYLLYLLVGNVLGTTLYYAGIMKPLHGEFKNRTWVQPVIYFVAAGVIGGFSMQYFVRAPAQWELSASVSREENEDCLTGWFPFHPFYDSHDAWHFLSAASLFLAFMGLLIVDDDLITTPQSQIPIF